MGRLGTPKRIAERNLSLTNSEVPLLLTEKATADFLGVSTSFLRKSRMEGQLRNRTEAPQFVRVGGRVYYRRDVLEAWVASLKLQRVV